jgi:hypothetical protein
LTAIFNKDTSHAAVTEAVTHPRAAFYRRLAGMACSVSDVSAYGSK